MVRFTVTPAGAAVLETRAGRGRYLHLRRECVMAFANARPKRVRTRFRSFGGRRPGPSRASRAELAALLESRLPS